LIRAGITLLSDDGKGVGVRAKRAWAAGNEGMVIVVPHADDKRPARLRHLFHT
jgi:hypothetical protein